MYKRNFLNAVKIATIVNTVTQLGNLKNKMITLKKLLNTYKKSNLNYKLPIMLGENREGVPEFADLIDLKHILMTGSTGSGKSTFEHTIISTFLSTFSIHQLKLLLVDMKRVEFLIYDGLPHLLSPVVVNTDKVYGALDWLIFEKNKRLKIVAEAAAELEKYPRIVVIIDTFSDLVSNNSVKFQDYLGQLMNQASDVNIHVVMSDSRPSPDVFTPLIQSLFPTKICFNVSSIKDSKLVIGNEGGEKLLGVGDMLFLPPYLKKAVRIQAPLISEEEVRKIIKDYRI